MLVVAVSISRHEHLIVGEKASSNCARLAYYKWPTIVLYEYHMVSERAGLGVGGG